jgi:predicted Na+-dependent transporter
MNACTNALLGWAGRNGPALLCGGVLIGLVAPALAEVTRPLMGLAVFVFTLGAFLKVDGAAFRAEAADRAGVVAALVWATFGVPLLAFALLLLTRPNQDVAHGLLLTALAPPVGSAAAIAAMLGLSAPLALLATVAATLASPFYLPPLAVALTGAELAIEPFALAARLGLIVGGAAGAAFLLRRFAGRWVADNPNAMTGIAVLGLLLVAVGAMRGMRDQILEAPLQAALLLAVAFLANAGFQVVGALLFSGVMERSRALTVGLVSGNRNITLIWSAAAPFLADRPGVELLLAMGVFPIFMLPAATRRILAVLMRRRTDAAGLAREGPTVAAPLQEPTKP